MPSPNLAPPLIELDRNGVIAACLRRGAGHLATNLDAWQQSRAGFSDGGVRLQLNGFEIPDDFALVFAPNELAQSGRYKVVWRLGNDVGAKFLGPTT